VDLPVKHSQVILVNGGDEDFLPSAGLISDLAVAVA